MSYNSVVYRLLNLASGDVHTEIDCIIRLDPSWTNERLVEIYDNDLDNYAV